MTKTLFGKILLVTLVIILLVSGVSGVFTNYFLKKYFLQSKTQEMIRQGERIVQTIVRQSQMVERNVLWFIPIRGMIKQLEEVLGARIWTMDREGRIYLEANPVRQLTDNELEQLLQGKIITKYNWGDELNRPILAVVLPVKVNQQVLGGLLIITPMEDIYLVQSRLRRIIITSAWIGAAVAVIMAYLFSRKLTKPIQAMQMMIARMRRGDFTGQIEISSGDELGALAQHFNKLSLDLDETIDLLQTEKEQTRRIINSMSEGVISLNEFGEVLVLNPAARHLLHLTNDHQDIGSVLGTLPGMQDQINQVMEKERPLIREIEHDGKILLSIVSPILTGEDQLAGVVIVLQDITNRWRLVQLQKELVANVSHEFKTPLTSIKGFAELMLDNKIKDEKVVKSSLEVIYQETARLIRMVEGLLKMARIESKRLHKEPVDLQSLIEKVVEGLSLKLQEAEVGVCLDISLPDKLIIDSDRMEQVFYNLLDNGIRFSPAGSQIQVTACLQKGEETKVEIQVRDQGPGIPINEHEMIFDRFYKIEKARSTNDSGTGLGLAIVKSIIEEHDGQIWVTNHPEGGALFTILLPV